MPSAPDAIANQPTVKRRRLPNKALTPAVIMLLLGIIFVGGRWHFATHGDVTRFIVAGRSSVDPAATPTRIFVLRKTGGYDGQFSYRTALDPLDLRTTANGVTYDFPLRLQRLVYPTLVWAAAVGRAQWVPWALVLVNVAGLFVLGWLSGKVAQHFGHHAAWGLILAGYWGFVFTLARDLTEIWTCVFLIAGVLALMKERMWWAGVMLALAVLSRETSLVIVAALAIGTLVEKLRESRSLRSRPVLTTIGAFSIPVAAFALWQTWCYHRIGIWPIRQGAATNLRLPFQDLVPWIGRWFRDVDTDSKGLAILKLAQFFALVLFDVYAFSCLRRSRAQLATKCALVIAAFLVVSLSGSVWIGPADFRTEAELQLLAGVVMLGVQKEHWIPLATLAVVGAGTFFARILTI